MQTPLEILIDNLGYRADAVPNSTKELRARKGAYVDAIVLAKGLLAEEERQFDVVSFNIKPDKLRLIISTLYRAYSLPYKRKVYDDGRRDDTYEQTEEEKDLLRKTALVLERKKKKKIAKE